MAKQAKQTTKQNNPKLRAVGYSRTSGKKRRGQDNTSLPDQKAAIEKFVAYNKWKFIRHYVDKGISGSKIEGRDSFKQMMKDATNAQFDFIVVRDIDRFARDGSDIIANATFVKKNFGIYVLDIKGFDSRKPRNTLLNFLFAGVAEDERLRIMERTIGGRVARAKQGLPWCPNPPVGRSFKRTGKHSGEWYVNEKGRKLASLLLRYADGEPLKGLVKEYGFSSPAIVIHSIHKSQLAGVYQAKFHAPEIDINNLRVPVEEISQVITPELEQRVLKRLNCNRRWNKQGKRRYLLTGFVKCGHCGRALIAQKNGERIYYRHYRNYKTTGQGCPYNSIKGSFLENHVLDYLYSFYLDAPAYNKAVKAALPSDDDRKALTKDISVVTKQLLKIDKGISNLVDAIANGADVALLLNKQSELKAQKQVLENRLDELNQTLENMPDPEVIQEQAMLLRLRLVEEHRNKDWRLLSYEDVRRFLHFLFGDNPLPTGNGQQTGYGISVSMIDDRWHITFKGCVEFYHDVVDGRSISRASQINGDSWNNEIKQTLQQGIAEANRKYAEREEKANKDYARAKARQERRQGAMKSHASTVKPFGHNQ